MKLMHVNNPEILLESHYALHFIYMLQIAAICHVIVMPGTTFYLFHLLSFFSYCDHISHVK